MSPGQAKVESIGEAPVGPGLLVAALPGAGLAGAIAGRYLAKAAGLEDLAAVDLTSLPPIGLFSGGALVAPIRVSGAGVRRSPAGGPAWLAVVHADLPVPAFAVRDFAAELASWAKRSGVETIVVFDGTEAQTPHEQAHRVRGVLATRASASLLERLDAPLAEEGLMVGFGVSMLREASKAGIPAACLLVETHPEVPDARAAAALVEKVGRLMPGMDLDPSRLLGEAAAFEEEIRSALAKHRDSFARVADTTGTMYG